MAYGQNACSCDALIHVSFLFLYCRKMSRKNSTPNTTTFPSSRNSEIKTLSTSTQKPGTTATNKDDCYTALGADREINAYAELKPNDLNYYETFGGKPEASGNGLVDIYAKSDYGGRPSNETTTTTDNEYAYVDAPGPRAGNLHQKDHNKSSVKEQGPYDDHIYEM